MISVLRAVQELTDKVAHGFVRFVDLLSFHFCIESDGAVGVEPSEHGVVAVPALQTCVKLFHRHWRRVGTVYIECSRQ